MVLQYKEKVSSDWKDYPGKEELKGSIEDYDFRLLSEDKKKVLGRKGSYEEVMNRMKQVESFKDEK